MITLRDGKIPAHTVCPFRSECAFAHNGTCKHKGKLHSVDFSCGAARAFELIKKNEGTK